MEPKNLLLCHEHEKKKKYNALCLEQHQHFMPLVFLVDGMQRKEAMAAIKHLARLLLACWKPTYSKVCGFTQS